MWWNKLEYFSEEVDKGFECSCGCGKGFRDMNPDFMIHLDKARERSGVPFNITSGFRCGTYNNKVSSTGFNGPHTLGRAADILADNSRDRYHILRAVIKEGFTRIGIHKDFIHVDTAEKSASKFDPMVTWLY